MFKMLVHALKCNYAEIFPNKSHIQGSWWTYKPVNSHSLAIFSSTVHLREVILALWTLEWVSACKWEVKNVEFYERNCQDHNLVSAYGRRPLIRGVR